jgi:hypothetical protein
LTRAISTAKADLLNRYLSAVLSPDTYPALAPQCYSLGTGVVQEVGPLSTSTIPVTLVRDIPFTMWLGPSDFS